MVKFEPTRMLSDNDVPVNVWNQTLEGDLRLARPSGPQGKAAPVHRRHSHPRTLTAGKKRKFLLFLMLRSAAQESQHLRGAMVD